MEEGKEGDFEDNVLDPKIIFQERWSLKEQRIRATSSVGHLPGWRLVPVILKSNDDLRQEQICAQLISMMHEIILEADLPCWLRPYDILALSADSGIIEAIPDTISLDCLKKRDAHFTTLKAFYLRYFRISTSHVSFEQSRDNFIRSLAPYSILCFILQIKDRHNGNILIDTEGHVIHIDYGFILGNTPGGNIHFESAPFKLTNDSIELMEGRHSVHFHLFRETCVKTFMLLRQHHHYIELMVEMLSNGNEALPCFNNDPQAVLDEIRKRFRPDCSDREAIEYVHRLIDAAANSWSTTCYDRYQRYCVGIL